MRNLNYILILCLLSISNAVFSAAIDWQQTIATNTDDTLIASSVGPNDTIFVGGDTHPVSTGNHDFWVAKMNDAGAVIWRKTLGGNDTDYLHSIAALPDGGALAGGWSMSGVSGDKTQPASAGGDYWLIRLNSTGNIVWQKTLGGDSVDRLMAITLTNDGNFVIAGDSYSSVSGDKTAPNRNQGIGWSADFWVLKLDLNGNILWQKTVGGSGDDHMGYGALTASQNGGVIVAGFSTSGISGEKTQASRGGSDYWVVKLDANGNKTWDKTFGGSNSDILYDVIEQRSGNIILGGRSNSPANGDKNAPAFNNGDDYWVLALNSAGAFLWQKTYGGDNYDNAQSLTQTLDDGILIAGESTSGISGNKSVGGRGGYDYWVIKLNATGQEQWQQVLGGSGLDALYSVNTLTDGSLMLSGYSNSPADGDKTAPSSTIDAWVIKLNEPLMGISAFHFEDPFGRTNTVFNCSGWDIYLNGAASMNEQNYYIDAWRRPIGSTQAFNWQATLGWTAGAVGRVNLTDAFAAVAPAPYFFDPGYEYQIKLAVQNTPYFGWIETVHSFAVPAQLGFCRHPFVRGHNENANVLSE